MAAGSVAMVSTRWPAINGMDAPSPAACAIVLHEPDEERTSQVSILGKAEFLASRRRTDSLRSAGPSAARRRCTSWSNGRSASWRPAAATGAGRSPATRSGCCRRSASSPSSSVNDAADAGAEAASRPTFVAVRTGEQRWVAGAQPGGSGRRFAVASSTLQLRRAPPTSGSLRCWRLPPCAPLKQGLRRSPNNRTKEDEDSKLSMPGVGAASAAFAPGELWARLRGLARPDAERRQRGRQGEARHGSA